MNSAEQNYFNLEYYKSIKKSVTIIFDRIYCYVTFEK